MVHVLGDAKTRARKGPFGVTDGRPRKDGWLQWPSRGWLRLRITPSLSSGRELGWQETSCRRGDVGLPAPQSLDATISKRQAPRSSEELSGTWREGIVTSPLGWSQMTSDLMGLRPVILESQNAMNAVDGATIIYAQSKKLRPLAAIYSARVIVRRIWAFRAKTRGIPLL